MRNHLSEQFHIDFENIRQDMGQEDVFLEMVNWDSDLYDQIGQDFDLPFTEEEDEWKQSLTHLMNYTLLVSM